MMIKADPYLYIYAGVGVLIVLATYIILSLFTGGVRAIHHKVHEAEKKKKSEERTRKINSLR